MSHDEMEAAFQWEPQPDAWAMLLRFVDEAVNSEPEIQRLATRMREETGTRFVDWIESIQVASVSEGESFEKVGFQRAAAGNLIRWSNPHGIFPDIQFNGMAATRSLSIKVECLDAFLDAHDFAADASICINGIDHRLAIVVWGDACNLQAVESHGDSVELDRTDIATKIQHHRRALLARKRDHASDADGFQYAMRLIDAAVAETSQGYACDAFFAAERAYWQDRNEAARVQKARQDALGLGWANHDHHTYRSSRDCFTSLVAALEKLGLVCRERFYAGKEAGWGAQVLEHPTVGIVVFADVDLSPEELATDFAHDPLPPRDELGTVGLWCKLHGESFLQAGMHHLECQFDFDRAREQLAGARIETMAPFTDFPHLRQAFTKGEQWQVDQDRLASVLQAGQITEEQAERFRHEGALGSHLEILERNDGYKGFNQTGVSDIIQRTDPRR